MQFLSKLFFSQREDKSDSTEIHDYEFLDKKGREFMVEYLAYYEQKESFQDAAKEPFFVDSLMSPLLSQPSYVAQSSWEIAHGPQHYLGGLKSYSIPYGIKRIGRQAFAYNLNLSIVSLPDTLEVIGKEAFAFCNSLFSLRIPASVYYIGKNAFDNNLEVLTMLCKVPPKVSKLGLSSNCQIFVPQNSLRLYKQRRGWKQYANNIHEIINSESL